MTLTLLQRLSRHDIKGNFDQEQIRQYVQGKLAELVQAKNFIESKDCGVFKGSAQELSELCDELVAMLKLRIFEVNQMVLALMQSLLKSNFFGVFNAVMLSQKLDSFVDILNGLFLQASPALLAQHDTEPEDKEISGNGFETSIAPSKSFS